MHALARPCHFSARDRSPRTRRARGWAAGLACRHDTHLLEQSCPRIRRRALHTVPRPPSGALHLAKARRTARARPRALLCTLATSTDASATLWPKFSRRVSLMGDERQHAPATLRNRDFIPPCCGSRCAGPNWLPYFPSHGDHSVSRSRWHFRECADHGRARKPAHDEAL
jgi:hypothetical protein